jgi:hypothetical protein
LVAATTAAAAAAAAAAVAGFNVATGSIGAWKGMFSTVQSVLTFGIRGASNAAAITIPLFTSDG